MKIYNYDKQGVFINQTTAKENPLETGKYLIPAKATTIAPPDTKDNEVAVFDGGEWQIKTDFRGVGYYIGDEMITIKEIGVVVPDDAVSVDEYNLLKEAEYEELTNSYAYKRQQEYPNMADYLDAKVKQASSDETTIAEGVAQEQAYLEACLAVKAKYPKPTEE